MIISLLEAAILLLMFHIGKRTYPIYVVFYFIPRLNENIEYLLLFFEHIRIRKFSLKKYQIRLEAILQRIVIIEKWLNLKHNLNSSFCWIKLV